MVSKVTGSKAHAEVVLAGNRDKGGLGTDVGRWHTQQGELVEVLIQLLPFLLPVK